MPDAAGRKKAVASHRTPKADGLRRLWLLAAVLLAAGVATAAEKDASDTPLHYSLTPLEQRLFADAADGRLHDFSLLEAALVASGVDDPASLAHYRRQVDRWVESLRRSGAVRGTPRQQARAIFEFLHRNVLTGGYSLPCTDLRQTIDRGRFNCVSASVLFECLAAEFGLKVCPLESPGHVMCRLDEGEGTLDIETTCPRWFQLLDHPPKPAATHASESRKDSGRTREISDVELVAMIYYNRGVDLLGEKRFAEAAASNAKALRLAPSNATARGNLLATLNNWAIELGSTAHYAEAAELLRLGLAIEPGYEAFRLNTTHLHRQWAQQLQSAPPAAAAAHLTPPSP
jgi:tetratricopeptide (TPR) repeat protein